MSTLFLWGGAASRGLAARGSAWGGWLGAAMAALALMVEGALAEPSGTSVVHRVSAPSERLEMTVNTSRILTLDQKIPVAQVNNPEVLELTALSPNQIQILAKRAGVTQVNLWDEQNQIHTVDVIVYGDAQELTLLLQSQFPTASLKVIPLSNSVLISGVVDDPNHVQRIVAIAEDYYPRVQNHITVAGVQQVLLQVRVMEVSRTKLRSLGIDFADLTRTGDFVGQSVSGLLAASSGATFDVPSGGMLPSAATGPTGGQTFQFGIVEPGNSFFGVIEALQQKNLAKILAEPNLVTVSGRPAFFNVGGEFPILVPQSLGTVSIQFRRFGTQVDFVPIVLGNGIIRLEVRPRVSEPDSALSVVINGTNVPALKVREVETGVEMRAGQTLAIAGLVQNRLEASSRGLPFLSDLPWIGAAFGRRREQTNEIELLILVTPQLVEAMDPCDVPPGGPGLDTVNPTDGQLYGRGHLEVPRRPPQATRCQHGMSPANHLYEVVSPQSEAPNVEPLPEVERSDEGNPHPELPKDESAEGDAEGLRVHATSSRRRAVPRGDSARDSRSSRRTWSGGQPAAKPPGMVGPVGYEPLP